MGPLGPQAFKSQTELHTSFLGLQLLTTDLGTSQPP